ncbi:MAG: dihydropteroate synthase [Oscillospiraceae bacterium]|nr:dihydropteroate synthase [Oscillospiraceae bacterium]
MMQAFSDGAWHLDSPKIMGILNVTPDSFSDGGVFLDPKAALEHAIDMAERGADIIDIGAQSTRPNAVNISSEEEIERLAPVLEILHGKIPLPLSVDTFYPEVAQFALENGVTIINDVSGAVLRKMAKLIKKYRAGWVIMHNPAGQSGAAASVEYHQGVVRAVREFFSQSLDRAMSFGVDRNAIIFDPGFGFGKDTGRHIELLENLSSLSECPLLVGLSRKRFVRELFGAERLEELDAASEKLHRRAITNGAMVVRRHFG